MSIKLDNELSIMLYRLVARTTNQQVTRCALIDRSQGVSRMHESGVQLSAVRSWTSPRSGAEYGVDWLVSIPSIGLELHVGACLDSCELDTRGTTNTFYWEGPASVRGEYRGDSITGQAFIEMVGMDPFLKIGIMDPARRRVSILGYLRNDIAYRLLGAKRKKVEHATRK